ncbi:FHA domain-containing protein [Persicimonas caeni]|uniref:FHA domain-containing protein n=1 Tax=Persicimonas caeni TaxID=2292766 RepID=A0A4Y6PV33_PERCE|nr:FHA domain-containing protein [Persicimonas caeni]QDG51857.1 FHA domain-containing protein [Persicimonas caeni]QED33078.1 FHA domain-containing protein [Persicimonas caeni]
MDEGKLASQALSGPSEGKGPDDSDDGIKMKGRFRNPVSDRLDLGSNVTDDEDAISQMAKRFRGPGAALSEVDEAPSLDSQDEPDPNISDDELQNFLLDALDSQDEPDEGYVLEEVDETVDTEQPIDQTDRMVDPPVVQPATTAKSPQSDAQGIVCSSCHASNPPGMRFCVQCGGSLKSAAKAPSGAKSPEPQRQPPPPSAAAKQENPWDVHLVSINEDGSDGISIPLEFLETTLGRDGDTRFPTDAFLSPKHARLHIENGDLYIEDLYSLNGTFLKLRDEVRLTPGDSFLMGRQVLRFERFEQSITPKTKSSDGTRYMGSPAPGGNYKILQIGIGNVVQNVYCLPESGAVLGREKGDIIFPHDKFMSSRHAQIYTGEDGQCYLVDLNSSNGTWTKLWEKTQLENGDYIFMGQQLFRVHVGKKK